MNKHADAMNNSSQGRWLIEHVKDADPMSKSRAMPQLTSQGWCSNEHVKDAYYLNALGTCQ